MSKLIYLASPFFNEFELECVKRAEKILTDRGFELLRSSFPGSRCSFFFISAVR